MVFYDFYKEKSGVNELSPLYSNTLNKVECSLQMDSSVRAGWRTTVIKQFDEGKRQTDQGESDRTHYFCPSVMMANFTGR